MNLQEAGDAPRILHEGSSEPTGEVMTDGGSCTSRAACRPRCAASCRRMGHTIQRDRRRLRRLPGHHLGPRPEGVHRRERVAQGRQCHGVLTRRIRLRKREMGHVPAGAMRPMREADLGGLRSAHRGGAQERAAREPVPVPAAEVSPGAPSRSLIDSGRAPPASPSGHPSPKRQTGSSSRDGITASSWAMRARQSESSPRWADRSKPK